MNREEVLYLAPYVFSLLLSLGVFLYTWQHRQMRGARVYSWFVGGQTLTIVGFILELVSPNLQIKLLWDKFQWLTDSFLVILPFLIFSVQFSESKLRYPRFAWGSVFAFLIIFTILLLTDDIHHLIYPNPHLSADYPFPELQYDFTIVVYIYALLFAYGANFYGISLLIKRAVQPHNLYRLQYWTIVIGFSIPLVLSFLTLANIQIAPQRDASPFSFAIGNMVVAWGLFRYRLFDIVPIARERIVENMIDPVVVLDARNRVVDMNKAALTTLGRQNSQVVGRHSSEVFAGWPIIASELEYLDMDRKEIAVEYEDDLFFYDISISSIRNNRSQLIGRIVVARDITKRKTLENGYRILSEELEQRVKERTEELAEAYDTTLEGWARALELRDKETEGHSRRVTETTLSVARAMGIHDDELIHIRRGSILHDIGKMGIPDDILRKNGALTDEERTIVQRHPDTAYELLKRISYLEKALEIPYCHHEKWDGSGYPRGLKGEDIPLSARIFAIADVWDALSSDRPYRKAWDKEKVIQYLIDESGKHFDPRVANVFLGLVEKGGI